ncbi:uncharacterized protein [Drosophila tropicalis]|uniref:uncharacterized protein n=1 Tax=Drosophila tropicalis TaxID=46794 RepID=UPI0035AC1BA9
MFFAQHAAIAPVDHLSELCHNKFGDSEIKLHRTKCTSLIKNVLAVHFKEDLREDVGNAKYSLLIDKTTDISITKILGVPIIYFSVHRQDMVSSLLSLISIPSGDAFTISDSIRAELNQFDLPLQNLIGIGTDNTNVMAPLKILRVCDTRWLSIESAVRRILEQWEELKLHFNNAALLEKCHKATILRDLYNDDVNQLYLIFLKPILEDMQRINKTFQMNNPNPTKQLGDLMMSINSLKCKIIAPNVEMDILVDNFEKFIQRDLYLGYEFESHIKKSKQNLQTHNEIRLNCTNFVVELISQLIQRLPDNFKTLKHIEFFSAENVLGACKPPIVELLELFKVNGSDIIK